MKNSKTLHLVPLFNGHYGLPPLTRAERREKAFAEFAANGPHANEALGDLMQLDMEEMREKAMTYKTVENAYAMQRDLMRLMM